MIALTCLIIGAKYDELDQKIPMIQDFQRVSRFMYRYEIVKQAEILVLKILDWNLKIVTPLHFIMLFLAQGVVFKGDTIDGREISPNDIVIVRKYALFFNDLCLQGNILHIYIYIYRLFNITIRFSSSSHSMYHCCKKMW